MRNLTALACTWLIVLLSGCTKGPAADFTADRTSLMEGESVQFTDMSTDGPTVWEWTFEGGTPHGSMEQDPLITYQTEGTFSVTLEVRNRGGSDMITRSAFITVAPANTDLVFVNTTHTDLVIEVLGDTRTVVSGEQTTYLDLDGSSVDYYAETSGVTSDGKQVGARLTWSYTVPLVGGTVTRELSVGTDYFCLYITNNGYRSLSPLSVNDGGDEIWNEQIIIPNDGTTYRIGYYLAWANTEVRVYWQDNPTQYTYWIANQNFTYPNEMNQSIELLNTLKKSSPVPSKALPLPTNLKPAEVFKPASRNTEGAAVDYPNSSSPSHIRSFKQEQP